MSGEPTGREWRNKRVRTPTVIQMEAIECGAAALGSVLGYYGLYLPLEKLREECGVSRDGSKASNIVRAARRFGLEAKGIRKDPDGLHQLKLPVILFWNFNHFVVFEGLKGSKAFINDPASGPRTVSLEELDRAFTGVALTFEPGPDFKPGGRKPGLTRALRGRLKGVKTGLAFAVLAGLGLVIPGLIIPALTKIFIDDVLISQKLNWFQPLLLGMLLTLVLQGLLTWLRERTLLRQQLALAVSTSAKLFHHILRLPYTFFTQRYAGEISSRVIINDRVAMLLSGELATAAISLLTASFYTLLMFYYDALLAGLGLALAGLNFAFLRYVSRKRTDLSQKVIQERGKLLGTAMNGLNLIETIKATGSESDFFSRWAGHQVKTVNAQQELLWWTNLLSPVAVLLNLLNTGAILSLGALRVIDGHLTMGMLVAFQSLMIGFMTPVFQMVNLGARFQEALGDMNRLDDVLTYPQDAEYHGQTAELEATKDRVKLTGELRLDEVSFGYSRLEAPLIRDFDLKLAPGARVALVGGSGSGKSTVAKLVCGLYQPWSGQIHFDGRTRSEVPRPVMLNSLSYVDQDIFLFSGTIRENLTMWNKAVSDRDVVRAARDAGIHETVSALNRAYDSPVVEGGRNFSGGQRQQLEIARALVTNPSLLVLDEATSALDPETEQAVDRAMRRRGCTCLIIAHRLSTIRDCDEIVVLDQGRVVQRGFHDDLIAQDGLYRRLIES